VFSSSVTSLNVKKKVIYCQGFTQVKYSRLYYVINIERVFLVQKVMERFYAAISASTKKLFQHKMFQMTCYSSTIVIKIGEVTMAENVLHTVKVSSQVEFQKVAVTLSVCILSHHSTFTYCLDSLGAPNSLIPFQLRTTPLWWFNVTSNNKTYLGLHVRSLIFFLILIKF
jgi:hypothetical protein